MSRPSASRATHAIASASVTSPSTTRCWEDLSSCIAATQPGACGWLPGAGSVTASIHGGVCISAAVMLRARASSRTACDASRPRSAAAECTSSSFALSIVSTDGEPTRYWSIRGFHASSSRRWTWSANAQ